jgi:PAS domain S-box-containing protein
MGHRGDQDPAPERQTERPTARRGSGPTDLLAQHLLVGAPPEDRFDPALAALGDLARADRVLLVSGGEGGTGSVVSTWTNDGVPLSVRKALRPHDEALAVELGTLLEARPFRIEAGGAPHLDDVLGREGPRVSTLALPIVTASGWSGYLAIERLGGSDWGGDAEVERLLQATRILGWGVERRMAEMRLREELEQTRTAAEEAPGLAYAHTDGEPKRILSMSPGIEEVLGYPAETWLRDPGFAWGLLHPEDRVRIEALDSLGAPPVMEYRMFARDGRMVWFCDATAPGHDSQGSLIHRGVLVDVTSLREADHRISEVRDESRAGSVIRAALLEDHSPQQVEPHVARLAENAAQYMREHLAEGIGLTSLSEDLAVSPGYLGRVFKRCVGTTPHQFLIDLRLEAAERLLTESDLTVSQIAWRVGFASPSHFVTTFRARTGTTPLGFRRRPS